MSLHTYTKRIFNLYVVIKIDFIMMKQCTYIYSYKLKTWAGKQKVHVQINCMIDIHYTYL